MLIRRDKSGKAELDTRRPVEAVVDASRDADLLIVGSRGPRGMASLGSVAERLAHKARTRTHYPWDRHRSRGQHSRKEEPLHLRGFLRGERRDLNPRPPGPQPRRRPWPASVRLATVIYVSGKSEAVREQSSFSKLERVKREEGKRRFRATTPGERVEGALRLSELAGELRSGLRTPSE